MDGIIGKKVLTSTSSATSSISPVAILLLLVDLFGLGYFNFTLKHNTRAHYIDFCEIHETKYPILSVYKNEWGAITLLPPTLWYFFSIAFLTGVSSLYVMNTNPLLFSVFGSCGSSMVSIYTRRKRKKKNFKKKLQPFHKHLLLKNNKNPFILLQMCQNTPEWLPLRCQG